MNWYKRQLKIAYVARRWNEEELSKIESLVKQGVPFSRIAKMYGVSQKLILNLNKKYVWRDLAKEKADRDKKILNLYLLPEDGGEGLSTTSIKKEYGFTRETVINTLKMLGLEDKIRGGSEANVARFQRPEEQGMQSKRVKQFYEENPEAGKEHGRRRRQFNLDNPEAVKEHAEKMRQLYVDEPERKKRHSELMIQKWKEWGGLEGRLKSAPTRDSAVQLLNNVIGNMKPLGKYDDTYLTYKTYMQIINDHTYPDEIQQQAI